MHPSINNSDSPIDHCESSFNHCESYAHACARKTDCDKQCGIEIPGRYIKNEVRSYRTVSYARVRYNKKGGRGEQGIIVPAGIPRPTSNDQSSTIPLRQLQYPFNPISQFQ